MATKQPGDEFKHGMRSPDSAENSDGKSPVGSCTFLEETQLIEEKQHGHPQGNLALTSFNYINSIIGSGILGIPYALHRVGFGMGVILLFVIAVITDFSLCILVEAANLAGVTSYQALMRSQFGIVGYAFLTFIQFSYPYIAMISYNIIIGDTITKVIRRFTNLTTQNFFGNRHAICFLVTIFVTYPLSLCRAIVRLSAVSFISLACAIFITGFILLRSVTMPAVIARSPDAFNFISSGVTEAIGVIAFAYMCHHNSFLLYESLKNATQERWNRVTHISMGVSCLIIVIFGICGYWIFTGFSQGDLFENFCMSDDWANAARMVFAVSIMLTYPIECFVSREVCFNSFIQHQDTLKSAALTTGIVFTTFLFSTLTDCLNIALELNGVLAAVPLAYIFPAVAYIKVSDAKWLSWKKGSAAVLAALGAVVALAGVINLIIDLSHGLSCSHGIELSYCNSSST